MRDLDFYIWLLVDEKEYFLSFEDYPWFKKATIEQITEVEQLSENHLYWESLDVDLSLNILEDPSKYPKISIV